MQARERQLISLKHRVNVLTEVSPLSQFKKRFYSACWWHWRDHFIGSFEELDWARARPSSIDAFAHSLTTTEAKFLESYRKAWPAQVYQLNQKPDSGFGATSQEWALATVISNCGLMFGDQANRWMQPTELLATQGFPVIPGVFNLDREKPTIVMQFQLQEGRADVLTLRDAGWQFHALFPNDGDPAFHFGEYS